MTTTRLYHSLSTFYSFFGRHKTVSVLLVAAILFFLYLNPLWRYFSQAAGIGRDFLMGSAQNLRQDNNRTNILILGLGGPKNEPSGLTDTIIFASFDKEGENTVLLSLLRDVWIPEMQAKLNTAYFYGNQKDGLGMEWAKRFVSEITGQPVHYAVVVSFDGFVEVVDLLGGVDVLVQRSFIDNQYPIPGKENDLCDGDKKLACRYETISFEKGKQHLSGEGALKFARSRNAEGEEGSDFARADRQQKIIVALKDKLLSPLFFLDPKRIDEAITLLGESFETDIPQSHIGLLAKVILRADREKIRTEVLNEVGAEGDEEGKDGQGFLYNPPVSRRYGGQWVLLPRADTWQPAQGWVECLLEGGGCPVEEFVEEIKD